MVALSLLWLPINMFWAAMLTTLLPLRVAQIIGDANKGTYLAIISALGAVATTVVQLIVGPISDACAHRWGRRHPFIFWGILGSLGAMFLFARAGNFLLLLLSFFGIQLFLNLATGPYQALLPDNVPPERHGAASAYMGVALLVGQIAGALSLLLLPAFGITGVLLTIAPLLLLGTLITLRFVPDRPALPEEQQTIPEALATLRDWKVREYPNFYRLLASRFWINLGYSTVVGFLFYYLQDVIGPKNQAEQRQMQVLIVATLLGLVGTVIAGRLSDRVPKKRIIVWAGAALAVAALSLGFLHDFTVALIVAGIFGIGTGLFATADWALACNLLPPGGAARYMAIWHVCMTVPQIIAPAFGVIADPLNRAYGHGLGWRAAMLTTVLYLCVGVWLLRGVRENTDVLHYAHADS